MKYTKFSEFIRESEEIDELSPERRKELDELFLELTDEEIDHLGQIMFAYFSEDDEDDEDEDDEDDEDEYLEAEFDVDDLNAMIDAIGSDSYVVINSILNSEAETLEDIFDEIDSIIDVDLTESLLEAIAKRMKVRDMNRARKFMAVTKAKLRASKAVRRVQLRKTKHKRRAMYRKNKRRIKAYQKSRADAIKRGKHIVKRRR